MSRDAGTSPPPAERIVRLGLVSDTHGLFHPELEETFRGVDAILHAGDVGSREVLSGLERIAPVHAVIGNTDVMVPELDLPVFAHLVRNGVRTLVTHYIGAPDRLLPPVAEELVRAPAHIVVSGHTHQPALSTDNGRLYTNPGSAGPQRFSLPPSCALLALVPAGSGARVEARVIDLDAGGVLAEEVLAFGDS